MRDAKWPKWIRCFGLLGVMVLLSAATVAQENAPADDEKQVVNEAAINDLTKAEPAAEKPANSVMQSGINFLSLLVSGGWMMIPIGLMSVLVVTVTLERAFALRHGRIVPRRLVRGLQELGTVSDKLDPIAAYKLCQRYPSAAASVIKTMLLKVGRPHSEIEHAVAEASQREADRLYANVRWLNMATAVTPLMGLLGTVWGMIEAFHATTQLVPGQDRAEQLAGGIYVALVTTLAGLMVAIPSAVFAHFYEGKITSAFRKLDELLFQLLAKIERFEGESRFDCQEIKPLAVSDRQRSAVAKPPVTGAVRPPAPPAVAPGSASALPPATAPSKTATEKIRQKP
jgi:biopolymer transport protein ExbB